MHSMMKKQLSNVGVPLWTSATRQEPSSCEPKPITHGAVRPLVTFGQIRCVPTASPPEAHLKDAVAPPTASPPEAHKDTAAGIVHFRIIGHCTDGGPDVASARRCSRDYCQLR